MTGEKARKKGEREKDRQDVTSLTYIVCFQIIRVANIYIPLPKNRQVTFASNVLMQNVKETMGGQNLG